MREGRSPEEIAEVCGIHMHERDHLARALGIDLDEVEPGRSRVSMTVRDDMTNSVGTCHGGIIFSLIGFDGFSAVREIFITPLIEPDRWQDLGVKAAPLILIAIGLAVGFRANVWNIGAEGQYIVGGLAGTGFADDADDATVGGGGGHVGEWGEADVPEHQGHAR